MMSPPSGTLRSRQSRSIWAFLNVQLTQEVLQAPCRDGWISEAYFNAEDFCLQTID